MCRAKNVAVGSKEHLERLQKWSALGKAWAQSSLGDMYSGGFGVKQDVKRAIELYESAANQGHHIAQFNLGQIYAKGRGGVIVSDTLSLNIGNYQPIRGWLLHNSK